MKWTHRIVIATTADETALQASILQGMRPGLRMVEIRKIINAVVAEQRSIEGAREPSVKTRYRYFWAVLMFSPDWRLTECRFVSGN